MTEKMNVSPTFIIGLGGTGSFALQYVKQKIRSRLEAQKGGTLPAQIPFIEYLVLDTILAEDRLEEFVPDEFMDIGRVNISRVLATLRSESDDKILKWFPRHLDPGQIDSGAGGVRAIGRLCFFLNESGIEERIRNKVKQITDSANIQNFLSEHLSMLQFEEAGAIDVHFVTSLCGGTGSACLLDTAYLVQHIIGEDTKLKPNCLAHLVTTEPFEGEPGVGRSSREYVQQNFAVSLSEIEHFTKKDAPKPWNVEYRNGTKVQFSETTKPFSLTYLLGYKEGVSLSRTQICEIIGETIAIKTVHPDGKRIKGRIENHKPHVINTEDAQQKRRTYSSYNAQILRTDVDEMLLRAGVIYAAKTILSSLCLDASPEAGEEALAHFEANVVTGEMGIKQLDFEMFTAEIEKQVAIKPADFDNAASGIRRVFTLSDGKRRKLSKSLGARVNESCEGAEKDIELKQRTFLSRLAASFTDLEEKTDEAINDLLSKHSLRHVSLLLAQISRQLLDIQHDLKDHRVPGFDRDFNDEIAKVIATGSIGEISAICSKRSRVKNHEPIFTALSRLIDRFKLRVDARKTWCDEARPFLLDLNFRIPEDEKVTRSSHTTNSVWTQADLNLAIRKASEGFVKRFVALLEHEYYEGEGNMKVCFLPHLNNSHEAMTKSLLLRAARETLKVEIDKYQMLMEQKASENMHEFVELASPAWQIEKTGEDIAAVSITNCPENSKAGQIMSRFGKNISFSQNGGTPREIILFRSEHGVSVNQLSNLGRCLDAVSRKLHREGKDRINDLCLDPEWDIAAPRPLRIEELRLDFTLAIHFKLIEPGFGAYTFKNASGATIPLRQNPDKKYATRRFEAFGKLLEFDCDGNEECKYLRDAVAERCSQNTQDRQSILSFRGRLLTHQQDLRQVLSAEKDVREHQQITEEIESLSKFIEQLNLTISQLERDSHGASS